MNVEIWLENLRQVKVIFLADTVTYIYTGKKGLDYVYFTTLVWYVIAYERSCIKDIHVFIECLVKLFSFYIYIFSI